jgi:hypothetical protein
MRPLRWASCWRPSLPAMANKLKKLLITVAALSALALGGAALAGAASGDSEKGDASKAITGDAKAKAEKAALAETGGGKVNQTELDNENGATYEVEVAKTDGSTVDVRLGDGFNVIAVEGDSEKADGPDQGPDANPDEPGHQDEKAGETSD